uniref:Uncharacterized protein n=1 Tax=Ditylenchus dipsaci TaxID=166011 RepID=A0A915EN33_9BILA
MRMENLVGKRDKAKIVLKKMVNDYYPVIEAGGGSKIVEEPSPFGFGTVRVVKSSSSRALDQQDDGRHSLPSDVKQAVRDENPVVTPPSGDGFLQGDDTDAKEEECFLSPRIYEIHDQTLPAEISVNPVWNETMIFERVFVPGGIFALQKDPHPTIKDIRAKPRWFPLKFAGNKTRGSL